MHWLSNACTLTQSLRKARGTLQCQVRHHLQPMWLSPIVSQDCTTAGLRMCALCATISYTTMAKLCQLLLAHSKRCWHSSSSHPPALCSLHTMQGKSISFTLQEPKAWVQAL